MGRISHAKAAGLAKSAGYYEAVFSTNNTLPKAVTVTKLVEHWARVNCSSQWTTRALGPKGSHILFFGKLDFYKARAHFIPNKPWSMNKQSIDGFHHSI